MPKNVHPAVEGLEKAFREGTARIEEMTPVGHFLANQDAAKRCQHCGETIRADAAHAWAIIEIERLHGDHDTCYPAFCDPTCLHEWSVGVDELETESHSTAGRR